MTATSDFDRLLSSVLAADGPNSVPATVIDAALVKTATIGQRRPLISVLDSRSWPARRLSFGDPRTARLVRLGVVAMLTLALLAVAVAVAANRKPDLLGSGERLSVWSGPTGSTYVFGNAEVVTWSFSGCARLVPGTNLVSVANRRVVFTFDLIDLKSTGLTWSKNYSGGERWSPDGSRVALFDLSGSVTIVSFGNSAETRTAKYETPGVGIGDWSLDGTHVVVPRTIDGSTEIEFIDVTSGERTTVFRSGQADGPTGEFYPLRFENDGSRLAILTGPLSIGGPMDLVFLDLASGTMTKVVEASSDYVRVELGAWTADGSRFVVETDPTTLTVFDASGRAESTIAVADPGPDGPFAIDLTWAPDGETLAFREGPREVAFREGDRLVVVQRDGTGRRSIPIGRGQFVWATDGSSLIVASPIGNGAVSVVRYAARDLTELVRVDSSMRAAQPSFAIATRPPTADEENLCIQLDPTGAAR